MGRSMSMPEALAAAIARRIDLERELGFVKQEIDRINEIDYLERLSDD